jgi:hypothetical protein
VTPPASSERSVFHSSWRATPGRPVLSRSAVAVVLLRWHSHQAAELQHTYVRAGAQGFTFLRTRRRRASTTHPGGHTLDLVLEAEVAVDVRCVKPGHGFHVVQDPAWTRYEA